MTEDEVFEWYHQLDRCEFEQVPGVGNGQESLTCCYLWDHKESDMTEWLNWLMFKDTKRVLKRILYNTEVHYQNGLKTDISGKHPFNNDYREESHV